MVSPPFSDKKSKGTFSIARGSIDFLKIGIESGNNLVPPDEDAFEFLGVTRITDPDNVDVTADWITNELDPTDPADVYNAGHATYVGLHSKRTITDGATTNGSNLLDSATADFAAQDVGKPLVAAGIPDGSTIQSVVSATQVVMSATATATATGVTVIIGSEQVGLFADGLGHVARKIKAPVDAEITLGNSNGREWTVRWAIRRFGEIVGAANDEWEEAFHVRDVGTLIFSTEFVSAADVKVGITTSLADLDILDIIQEAEDAVGALLEECFIDPDSFTEVPRAVRVATVLWARGIVRQRDATAFKHVSQFREGSIAYGFAGVSTRDTESDFARSERMVRAYARANSKKYRPVIRTVRRRNLAQGRFDTDE